MPIFQKASPYVTTPFPTFHTTPELPNTGRASELHVIVPITNTCRYASRYSLFEKFEKMAMDAGARLWIVEAAFGNRPHAVTNNYNPQHIQLRTYSELWHKENLINIGISRLPADWEYVAWIDADVSFARHDWVNETLNQLQHFDIVQMFSCTHDLAPDYTVIKEHKGFVYKYKDGGFDPEDGTEITITDYSGTRKLNKKKPGYYAHPGFAWAARRSAVNALGGLLDCFILGSADWHMAYALIGQARRTMNPKWSKSLTNFLLEWEQRAEKYIRRNVGYVPGSIFHHWHGRKKDRKYANRGEILINNNYDPLLDLKRDSQGLWQLTDRSLRLRDQIRDYMRSRNEDSTTVE
jgi:hypothetical protein